MRGTYVMSRLFPRHILELLESDNFMVIQAPKRYENAREREFYEYLFELMKDREFSRNKFCLWHAKYGGETMYPLGRQIAAELAEMPDYVVSCLGAGTTLEGLQIAVQDHFKEQGAAQTSQIVIAEHELSPLFAKFLRIRTLNKSPAEGTPIEDYYYRQEGLPHIVIGPHYDEINPLLSKGSIERIESVVQYSETDWKRTQQLLGMQGLSMGNSSAANLNVSAKLASEGRKVLTIVFEPFREFYRQR